MCVKESRRQRHRETQRGQRKPQGCIHRKGKKETEREMHANEARENTEERGER
jgi:hypothetical protein